jgi:hypothetical protein
MTSEVFFVCGTSIFGCIWIVVILLYLLKIVPVVKKMRDWRALAKVGLQLGFSSDIRQYGVIAKETKDRAMLKTYYILNILVVVSMLVFLATILSTIEF